MRKTVAALLLLAAAAGAEERYEFFLGDEKLDAPIVSLEGTPQDPRPGDLVKIDEVWITLGEPGTYRLRFERDRIFRTSADGAETLLAATTRADLSREEMGGLRGLRIGYWDDAIKGLVGAIDPATTCVTLSFTVRDRNVLLELPATLERLCVESRHDAPFPLTASLGRFRSLRVLLAPGADVKEPYGFKDLPELRFLNVWGAKGVRDVGFVAGMPRLRMLGIADTDVADLGPLAGHPSLAYVQASGRSIERLPSAPMPALRELVAYGAKWSDEARAAFLRDNPECKLTDRWEPALREALATCDRIRVRSGGTCCREERAEETLFEVRDAEEIRGVISGITIHNVPSSWSCMCCGYPTFEFYAGKTMLAMLGFHHGRSLRWAGGSWPGDAPLTEEGEGRIKQWLARHGVADVEGPSPIRYSARRLQVSGYRDVLAESFEIVWDAEAPEDKAAALKAVSDVAEERVAIWLRVLGCHDGGWDRATGLDAVVLGLLAEVPQETLAAALPKLLGEDDHAGRDGAARWLLCEDRWTGVPAEELAAVLPEIARRGLAHPDAYSRRRAVLALGGIGSPEAVAALRAFVLQQIEPRRASEIDEVELPGTSVRRDDPEELLGADSERVVAAFLLLRLGDVECLAEIRELAEASAGANAELLRRGLKALEER
jgi:hypothetical protein